MLQREEELRLSQTGLQKMAAAREWLDVAEQIQSQVVQEFGIAEEQGLKLLRSATLRFPELRQIAVYARNNLARDGRHVKGDCCPDLGLLNISSCNLGSGEHPQLVRLHSLVAESTVATVLCAGSYS